MKNDLCKKVSLTKAQANCALRRIRKLRAAGNKNRKETHKYKCGNCGHYHLTSAANSRKKQ